MRKLVHPITFAGLSERVEEEIERAYWKMLALQDKTQTQTPKSERDAFKISIREMFERIRQAPKDTRIKAGEE